ncbi:scabin-related ADP-ribosyltransferase [Streptomyces sp. DSM 15324]|uniref:WXG100-like domain-containing protein n=1 Tax=Streptomyces sp. DSM 15324 TaxID=1739111 RepID=UPI0007461646|nr:hypothetical protein [Streptomyces sp. DSM 15324]KUO09356.1 hypothetical protein AQJ58_25510 [Streptomyces sp. DSM 15324]
MSLMLPPGLNWLAQITVGENWPRADEDKMRQVAARQREAGIRLAQLSNQLGPVIGQVLESMSGSAASEFTRFMRRLRTTLPQMSSSSHQLGKSAKDAALQVEYAKLMIIMQMILMAIEIAHWLVVAPAAVPGIVAAGRVTVRQIMRRLFLSILGEVAAEVGLDAVAQTIQILRGDRTSWDRNMTLDAVKGGVIGGAVGGLVAGAAGRFTPRATQSAVGQGMIEGVTGVVEGGVSNALLNDDSEAWMNFVSGFVGGAIGGADGEGPQKVDVPELDGLAGGLAGLEDAAKSADAPAPAVADRPPAKDADTPDGGGSSYGRAGVSAGASPAAPSRGSTGTGDGAVTGAVATAVGVAGGTASAASPARGGSSVDRTGTAGSSRSTSASGDAGSAGKPPAGATRAGGTTATTGSGTASGTQRGESGVESGTGSGRGVDGSDGQDSAMPPPSARTASPVPGPTSAGPGTGTGPGAGSGSATASGTRQAQPGASDASSSSAGRSATPAGGADSAQSGRGTSRAAAPVRTEATTGGRPAGRPSVVTENPGTPAVRTTASAPTAAATGRIAAAAASVSPGRVTPAEPAASGPDVRRHGWESGAPAAPTARTTPSPDVRPTESSPPGRETGWHAAPHTSGSRSTASGSGTASASGTHSATGTASASASTSSNPTAAPGAPTSARERIKGFLVAFAAHVERDDTPPDFTSAYADFLDAQEFFDSTQAWKPAYVALARDLHADLAQIRADQAAQPTPIPPRDDATIRLYRKMSTVEAAQILDRNQPKVGLVKAMAYHDTPQHRKFFTTSLSHTSVFHNANAATDTETVLEFQLPENSYWDFVKAHGTPNQQSGAYTVADSALLNQEQLVVGPAANFTVRQQVEAVHTDRTHHNIGIAPGNVAEFVRHLGPVRVVGQAEIDRSVRDARATAAATRAARVAQAVQQRADRAAEQIRQEAEARAAKKAAQAAKGPHAAPGGDAETGARNPAADADSDPFGTDPALPAGAPVQVAGAVEPPSSAELVAGLLDMPAGHLSDALTLMGPDHVRWLAAHQPFVDGLRTSLTPAEFAGVAARLLVVVPGEASRPVSARHEAHAQVTRMLGDPEVTARLLLSGASVVVLPQDVPLTDVSSFTALHGATDEHLGRSADDLRGAATPLTAAIPEENLLGEDTPVGPAAHQPDGYSSATHEIAHLIHMQGLTDADREVIDRAYRNKLDRGPAAQWPDGVRQDLDGDPAENYSSTDAYEYFAQATNAYLGTNHGRDGMTGRPRNNGAAWVREHEPDLSPLLEKLYGTEPDTVHGSPANPVTATAADNARYEAFRDFTDFVDGIEPDAAAGHSSRPSASTADGSPAADRRTGKAPAAPAKAGEENHAPPLHGPAEARQPATRITADAMERFYTEYLDHFDSQERHDNFNNAYFDFLAGQQTLDPVVASHEKVTKQLEILHGKLAELSGRHSSAATPIPHTGDQPIRLYRKMSPAEAAQILGADSTAAGMTAAMNHNRSDEYRKYFTTSLSHTSVFTNENASSDSDVVLEFEIPWKDYWRFVQRFGTPNQLAGAYGIATSALVHQERLRTGPAANFRTQRDVDLVREQATHHNIGIGHGNLREFNAMLRNTVRVVPAAEVETAARQAGDDARRARRAEAETLIRQQVAPLREREAQRAAEAAGLHGAPTGETDAAVTAPGRDARPETHDELPPADADDRWKTAPSRLEEPEPGAYVRGFGSTRDGAPGLAGIGPIPAGTIADLRARITADLGLRGDADSAPEVTAVLDRQLAPEQLEEHLPALLSEHGHRITVPVDGRRRTVDVRLSLDFAGRSDRIGENGAPPPEHRVERRAMASQSMADSGGSATSRVLPAGWSGTFPVTRLPLTAVRGAVQLSLTHNQQSGTTSVTDTVQMISSQRSNEPSQRFAYDTSWLLRVDDDGDDAGNTGDGPARAPGAPDPTGEDVPLRDLGWKKGERAGTIDVWFPQHLASDDHLAGPERRPADLDDLPLWSVDSLSDPERLAREVRDHFSQDLSTLSAESAQAVDTMLSESELRGAMTLLRDGMYSPVLVDAQGNAVGMLKITAVVVPGTPLRSSVPGKLTLESHLSHAQAVDVSTQVTSGVTVDGSVTFPMTSEHPHQGTAPIGTGGPTGRLGGSFQTSRSLGSGGGATLQHSVRTTAAHLLTTADVTYTVEFVRARGGSRSHDFGRWQDGLRLRVPTAETAVGRAPDEVRGLPPALEQMRSIGVSATPLGVDGADGMFARAETWLREQGYLPPADPASSLLPDALGEADAHARLANLRRFQQARSSVGRRAAIDSMVDGGYALWLDRPSLTGAGRVQVRLTAVRDTDLPSRHVRTLPDIQMINAVSMNAPGNQQRSTAWSLSGGGGVTGSGGVPKAPAWLGGGADLIGEHRWTDVSSAASGLSHDQLTLSNHGQAAEVFEVPVRLGLDVYGADPRTPLARFTDAGPEEDPSGHDVENPAPAEGRPRGTSGTLRVAVPHHRTVEAGPRPGGPAARRIPAAVQRPVEQTDLDRLAVGADDSVGSGVFRVPGDAVVDVFAGSRDLIDAFSDIVAPTKTDPPAADGAQRGAWQSLTDTLASVLPASMSAAGTWGADQLGGPAADDQRTLAAEALRAALSPAHLLGRAHQILGSGYVVEGVTLPGMASDHEFSVELRAYASTPGHHGDMEQYLETGVSAPSSTSHQVKTSSGARAAVSLSARRDVKDNSDTSKNSMVAPALSLSHRRASERSETLGAKTATGRTATEDNREHRLRSDVTFVVTVRHGRRNAFGNLVGIGAGATASFALDVPQALDVLVTEAQVRRNPSRFEGIPALDAVRRSPHPGADAPPPALPDRFARTGRLGLGVVLDSVPLAERPVAVEPSAGSEAGTAVPSADSEAGTAVPSRRPGAGPAVVPAAGNTLYEKLLRQVELEAPGATVPGHSAYVPGVRSRIADHTSQSAMRALPGRGPADAQRFHFVHTVAGGARLVEVALTATPHADTAGLRAVRGRATVAGTGIENAPAHAPTTTSSGETHTRQNNGSLGLVTRHPRAGDALVADRTGPSLGIGTSQSRGSSTSTTWEDRFWLRSDHVADFEVDYDYTSTVRSAPLGEWPPNLLGAYLRGGIVSWGDSPDMASWLAATFGDGVPTEERTTVRNTLRFVAGETPAEPERRAEPVPFAFHDQDPAADRSTATGAYSGPALTPREPVVVYDFDGGQQLREALALADPALRGQGILPDDDSQEHAATRLGELIRLGRVDIVRPDSQVMPGAWPQEGGRQSTTTVTTKVYHPRPVTESRDVILDRLRQNTTAVTSSTSTATLPNLSLSTTLTTDRRIENHMVGLGTSLTAPKPVERGQTLGSTHTRREWLKAGTTTAPDEGGLRTYETEVDVVITVTAPSGIERHVAGSTTVRLAEQDLLGHGVTGPNPQPGVHDLRSMLRDQRDEDQRDWSRHQLTDLPATLAAGLEGGNGPVQLWLAADIAAPPATDGVPLLGRALYAASRTAALTERSVELVLRTDEGAQNWPFDGSGRLRSGDPATVDAWNTFAGHAERHALAAAEQAQAHRAWGDRRGQAAVRQVRADVAVRRDRALRELRIAERELVTAELLLERARARLASLRAEGSAAGAPDPLDTVREPHVDEPGTADRPSLRDTLAATLEVNGAERALRAARQRLTRTAEATDRELAELGTGPAERTAHPFDGSTTAEERSAQADAYLRSAETALAASEKARDEAVGALRVIDAEEIAALGEQLRRADEQRLALAALADATPALREARRASGEGRIERPVASLTSRTPRRPATDTGSRNRRPAPEPAPLREIVVESPDRATAPPEAPSRPTAVTGSRPAPDRGTGPTGGHRATGSPAHRSAIPAPGQIHVLNGLNRTAVDVPHDGDCLFSALLRTAPGRIVEPDGSIPTSTGMRQRISTELLRELELPAADRTLWDGMAGQVREGLAADRARRRQDEAAAHRAKGPARTEAERRAEFDRFVDAERLLLAATGPTDDELRRIAVDLGTPGVYDSAAGDLALGLATRIYGFNAQVIGHGSPYPVGDGPGAPVVLVRLDRTEAGVDHWMATGPRPADTTASAPSAASTVPATSAVPNVPGGGHRTARTVARPVTRAAWTHRRADAPVARLSIERFDPARDPAAASRSAGTLAGSRTLIRYSARRVQAEDGTWVRDFTLNLPVRRTGTIGPSDLTALQGRLQALLDTHVNTGYALPKSGDQLHVGVRLVDAPDHAEHITLTDTPGGSPLPRARQRTLDLRHSDGVKLHEMLHYLGLPDTYVDPDTLFRQSPDQPAVRKEGVMTATWDLVPGTLPHEYVERIESIADSHLVLRDHPLPAPSRTAPSMAAAEPARGPEPYSTTDSFDDEFAALTDGSFPVHAATDRWTVWGVDGDAKALVAEIPALGLRGTHVDGVDRPHAGPFSDPGRSTRHGREPAPAWNWYLPGEGAVASSHWRAAPLDIPHRVGPRPPVDPAVTAARRTDPAALPEGARWRLDDDTLHVFSDLAPQEVFRTGLLPGGDRPVHLLKQAADAPTDSSYLTATRRTDHPLSAGARWRYDLEVPGGIDLNATLDIASPFPDRHEVLFPGGVDARFVHSARRLTDGVPDDTRHENPGFAPAQAAPDGHGGHDTPTSEAEGDDRWETSHAPLEQVTQYRIWRRSPEAVPFHRIAPLSVVHVDTRQPGARPLALIGRERVREQGNPTLRVSGDRTLAINAAGPGVQEVYATKLAVDRANRELAEVGSKVTLAVDPDVRIELPLQEKPLLRVVPSFPPGATMPAECNNFAAQVLGGLPDAIVLRNGQGTTVPVRTKDIASQRITSTHELVHSMSVGVRQGHWFDARAVANDIIRNVKRDEQRSAGPLAVGALYQSVTSAPMPLRWRELSSTIGVNEHALARVGDGYLIQSTGDVDPNGSLHLSTTSAFGYHFATTVLASEDGTSHVTLENRNRRGETQRVADEAAAINAYNRQPEGTDRTGVQRLSRDHGLMPRDADLWHFRIYGGSDEGIHRAVEQPVPATDTAVMERPFTAVVTGGRTPNRFSAVRFEEKAKTLDTAARNQIKDLAVKTARNALWSAKHGLVMPTVTITGYGSNSWTHFANATGNERAAYTAGLFQQFLGEALDDLQRYRPPGLRITPEEIGVRTATGGNRFPTDIEARGGTRRSLPFDPADWLRTATIEIDIPPFTLP